MNIRKLVALGIMAFSFLFFVSFSYASDDHLKLGSKGQLDPKACDKEGEVVINVEEKVKNDVDSGFGGWWAIDNYTRHIKVWRADSDAPYQWCAVLKYEGKFDAVSGQTGPGNTGFIGANVKGEMEGGYRATFDGDLKSSPLWPTHGSVGTVDYGCNISGDSSCHYVSWTGQYFDNVNNFDQPWWGWIYKAGRHGTWLNQIGVAAVDSGNIL